MGRTCVHAQTAADAPIQIENRLFVFQMKGFHLTALGTYPAALACFQKKVCNKWRRYYTGRLGIPLYTPEHTTATATAGTKELRILGIARLEHKGSFLGPLKDFQSLFQADGPTLARADALVSNHTKHEATFLRFVASLAQYAHLLPADAVGNSKRLMSPHQPFGSLVVHDHVLNTYAFVHRDRAHLRDLPPVVEVEEGGPIFFEIFDKPTAEFVHLFFPDAHHKLLCHVLGGVAFTPDAKNKALLLHLF
jgi:hypothetical protein